MLIDRNVLDALVEGRVDLAFRRWASPRVKVGTRMRTSHGLVEVLAIDEVEVSAITMREAKRAGEATREALIARLEAREGVTYRIRLRSAGADPRVALREKASLSREELDQIRARLDKLDRARPSGPWTRTVLQLIANQPAVRAPNLAAGLGREVLAFKRDVRKLKELGLTESLEIGYRLSPRGRAVLKAL